MLAAGSGERAVLQVAHQDVGAEVGYRGGLFVDALFIDHELLRGAGGKRQFEAVVGGGLFLRFLTEQRVIGTQRVLEDQSLGLLIHVAHGVGARFLGGVFGVHDAAAGVDFAHDGGLAAEGFGDARAQIDGVADEAFVAGLEGFHQGFPCIGARVVDRDGAAVQRLAAGVGQLRCVGRMLRTVVGIDQQLAPFDGLLQEGQHGGFVLADGDGLRDAVFEEIADLAAFGGGGDGTGGHADGLP